MTNWSNSDPPLTTTEKEQALRRATQYMEQAFRGRWVGVRLHKDQGLSWPRWNVIVDGYPVDPDVVPTVVANACADLAFKAASGDLNVDLTRAVTREKVGPIETEYERFSPQATRYRSLEMALAPYLKGSTSSVQLVRA
jgi:hypothetical protein